MTGLPAGGEKHPAGGTFDADRRPGRMLSPGTSRIVAVPAFTSTLPVAALVLSQQAWVIPLAGVMGYSAFHVGRRTVPSGRYAAMKLESRALDQARALALERLAGEACRAAANAVVGVKIDSFPSVWSQDTLELKVSGTAVALGDRPAADSLLLTNLSVQDHWKLQEAAPGAAPALLGRPQAVDDVLENVRQVRTHQDDNGNGRDGDQSGEQGIFHHVLPLFPLNDAPD